MLINGARTQKTALIMISNLFTTVLTSVFALVINQKILATLGSDYNGVNSTATQVITILSLIEGGFTLATQVALYKPVANGNQFEISRLVSYSARKMRMYGGGTLLVGIVVSIPYTFLVKSDLSYYTILGVMILSVIGAAFNLGVVSQYRILFQVTQTEYKYVYINISSQLLLCLTIYLVLNVNDNILVVRLVYLLIEVARGVATVILAKKIFRDVNYHASVDGVLIKGTKEVFVAKITTLIYNSAPVLFISTFVGTESTSVYAVYLSVTNIMSSILTSIVNAPMHGLGQLISEEGDEEKHRHLIDVYNEYETLIAMANAFLCSVTFVMLSPFVYLYTLNVTDVNYVDVFFTVIMVMILVVQVLHIPSGTCINVAGKFTAVRNIQLMASIVLVISVIIGTFLGGLKGLLIGKLFTAMILAVVEVVYNYKCVVRCKLTLFIRIFLTTYLPAFVIGAVEYSWIIDHMDVNSWVKWGVIGLAASIINVLYFLIIGFVFNQKTLKRIINRFIKNRCFPFKRHIDD